MQPFVSHPAQDLQRVFSAIKAIPKQDSINVHHLRRVVKKGYLPENLIRIKNVHAALQTQTPIGIESPLVELHATTISDSTPTDAGTDLTSEGSPPRGSFSETVYIFLAPSSLISKEDLYVHLQSRVPNIFPLRLDRDSSDNTAITPEPAYAEQPEKNTALTQRPIFTLPVPAHAPTSLFHAAAQSSTLWPTTYNPNTSYGPNPSLIASAQAAIEASAASYISLARHAGVLAHESGSGQGVGAVIVERTETGSDHVVAVAGDRRWENCDCVSRGNGDPSKHAVMRAINFVARKRRAMLNRENSAVLDNPPFTETQASALVSIQPHSPPQQVGDQDDELARLEQPYLDCSRNLAPNGYLCLNLEVYTSHEPCVMCSMALVHSRVGKVVFRQRMPKTGGLTAEQEASTGDPGVVAGLGYGLFWRESLNWRFLCWEWEDEDQNELRIGIDDVRGDGGTVANNVHA